MGNNQMDPGVVNCQKLTVRIERENWIMTFNDWSVVWTVMTIYDTKFDECPHMKCNMLFTDMKSGQI